MVVIYLFSSSSVSVSKAEHSYRGHWGGGGRFVGDELLVGSGVACEVLGVVPLDVLKFR